MARVVHYRHCRLVKPVPTGEKVVVSWIPEAFAEVYGAAADVDPAAGRRANHSAALPPVYVANR